jgi:hypothetical protein
MNVLAQARESLQLPTSDPHFGQILIGSRDYPVIPHPARTPCRARDYPVTRNGKIRSNITILLLIINIIINY